MWRWALVSIGRYVSLGTIIATAVLLLFRDLLQKFIPLSVTQLLAIPLAAIAVLLLDVLKSLNSSRPPPVSHTSIWAGLNRATTARRSVHMLRVLASSTETILPALRDSDVRVHHCMVLMQQLDESQIELHPDFPSKTRTLVREWVHLREIHMIERLRLRRFRFTPTLFMVILDHKSAVFGQFCPTPTLPNPVQYIEPMLVDDSTPESAMVIDKLIQQFDAMFEHAVTDDASLD